MAGMGERSPSSFTASAVLPPVDAPHMAARASSFKVTESTMPTVKVGQNRSVWQRLAKWVHRVIVQTQVGFIIDCVQTMLSFVACLVYVAGTYLGNHPTPPAIVWCEYIFGIAFALDYLLHLFISENKMVYVFSWGAAVDLLAILPVLAINTDTSIGFLRVFRVFRVLRILRGYRMFASADSSEAGVSRQVAVLAFYIVSFVFVASGFAHSLEMLRPGSFIRPFTDGCQWERYRQDLDVEIPEDCGLTFFTTVYLVLLTATTLGLGDIFPSDDVARAMTLGILLPLFYIIPREIAKLSELLSKQSKYSKRFQGSVGGHVIVCGSHIRRAAAEGFLSEFYHSDHGEQKRKVVFVCPVEPAPELEALLLSARFENNVQYITGSPLVSAQFAKARPYDADAVFTLTSQFEEDSLATDASAVLTVKAVTSTVPWVPVYCQLVNPMSKIHASWAEWSHLVCTDELKMNILAKSCLCPGFSTLVANLITSSSDYDVGNLGSLDKEWVEEYLDGYGQEVYLVELSKAFVGKLFCVAANICFNEFRVCLFGVETRASFGPPVREQVPPDSDSSLSDSASEASTSDVNPIRAPVDRGAAQKKRILINPKDYLIRSNDRAFVIAEDHRSAMAASTWRSFNPRTDPEVLDITPADKRTFTRLNNGHGRLLKGAQSRISSSAHSEPHTVTRGSRVWSARDEDVMPGSGSRPLSSPSPMAGTEPAEAKALSPDDRRTSSPAGLAETSATSTVGMIPTLEVATFLRGHIIICGAPSGLQHFITPLRTSTSVPIVILDVEPPEVRRSAVFRNVFFVPGSSLNVDDLVRAGIETASMAVVLSHQSQVGDDSDGEGVSIGRDVDSVFTVCVITATFGCRTLVELAEHESMKFLPHRPQFCGGFVYSSTTLDTLLCQAYYNKSLLPVLSHLITPYAALRDEEGAESRIRFVENKHVVQMRVPKPYIDREYRMLWMELVLTRGELPIAIYRCCEAKNAPLPYVIANPRPSTRLHAGDRIFVLCGESLMADASR